MSILIKGAEMPKTCHDCRLYDANFYVCTAADRDVVMDDAYADNGRCSFCPLVEVPTPHGRLIDADAMLKAACEWQGIRPKSGKVWPGEVWPESLEEPFWNAPTVIEAEGKE